MDCGHRGEAPCAQCVVGNSALSFMTDYQKRRLEVVAFQRALRSGSSSQYTNYRSRYIERYKNKGQK